MLQIRQNQMRLFAAGEVRKFEDWMAGHIRKFFPLAASNWNEGQLIELIRHGIRRSAKHGLRNRRAVCKYIDLMIVFGRDFDTDSNHPWASRALRDWKTETGKIEALFRAGLREEARSKILRPRSTQPR